MSNDSEIKIAFIVICVILLIGVSMLVGTSYMALHFIFKFW